MNPLESTNVAIPHKEKGLNLNEFMTWRAVWASAKVYRLIADEALELLNK